MAGNREEISLQTWDRCVPTFIGDIDAFANEAAANLLKTKLQEFRAKIENQTANFTDFRAECKEIIRTQVPESKRPPMTKMLDTFLKVFLIFFAAVFLLSLLNFILIKATALFGLITLTSLNFKVAAGYAAAIGGLAGTLATHSLFKTQTHLNNALDSFSQQLNGEPKTVQIGGLTLRIP